MLYFLLSTLVLTLYIDVVLSLSIRNIWWISRPIHFNHIFFSLTPCSSSIMSCSSVLLPGVAALRHEICSSGTTNSNTSLGGKPRVLLNRDEHGIVSSRMTPRNVCSWRKITKQLLYSVTHCGLVMSYGDRSGPTLAQIMDCCLTAPSHYLSQCWLIIKGGFPEPVGNPVLDIPVLHQTTDLFTIRWDQWL